MPSNQDDDSNYILDEDEERQLRATVQKRYISLPVLIVGILLLVSDHSSFLHISFFSFSPQSPSLPIHHSWYAPGSFFLDCCVALRFLGGGWDGVQSVPWCGGVPQHHCAGGQQHQWNCGHHHSTIFDHRLFGP